MKHKPPKRYQPKGFEILYEDSDIIVGNKAPGLLTVAALYEREQTVHQLLNAYVRKGNSKSRRIVFVVHRLDRETSGVLVFAKNERAQQFLKNNWKENRKIYMAVVHGRMPAPSGTISSYLEEDEDYHVHSSDAPGRGRLSHTAYKVVAEKGRFSLLEIDLLTGRKNQIRVHLSGEGHPIAGDVKYGAPGREGNRLALHARSITLTHPSTKERMTFETEVPSFFYSLTGG